MLSDERKRILFITRNFPPLVGGMERLAHNAYLELNKGFELALVGPEGCIDHVPRGSSVASCRIRPTAAFLLCLEWKASRLAKRFAPHLIIAGSGLAARAARSASRTSGAPVACLVHGLDLVVASSIYRRVFLPAIRRCDLLIANSRHTATLAIQAGAEDSRLEILNPGVSLPGSADAARRLFRALVGGSGRRLLLSVGRIQRRKGLMEFVQKVLPPITASYPDVLFVVIGEEAHQALHRSTGEKRRILDAAQRVGVAEHLLFLGAVDEEVLSAAYLESDALVFPVIDLPGDVEGFGMVALEAAAHGLPTVAFAVGGVADAVADGVSGYLVCSRDYPAFANALRQVLDGDRRAWQERCRQHAKGFIWEHFGEKLRVLCNRVIEQKMR